MEQFLIDQELRFFHDHPSRSGASGESYSVSEYQSILTVIRESGAPSRATFIDLGSGTGSAILALAGLAEYEGSTFVGVELDQVFFQESQARLQRAKNMNLLIAPEKVQFVRANIMELRLDWFDEMGIDTSAPLVIYGFDFVMPKVVIQHEWAQLFAPYKGSIMWITTQNPAKYSFKESLAPRQLANQLLAGDIRYRERIAHGFPETVMPPVNAVAPRGGDGIDEDDFIVHDEDDKEVSTKDYMGDYYDRYMADPKISRFMKGKKVAVGLLRIHKTRYMLELVEPLPGDTPDDHRAVEMNRFMVWVYEKRIGDGRLEVNSCIMCAGEARWFCGAEMARGGAAGHLCKVTYCGSKCATKHWEKGGHHKEH